MELLDEAGRVFRVMRFVFKPKGHIIMFFAGITERSQAEALKGLALYLPKESLPSLEEGAFYAHALVGCVVFSLSGCKIGHISRVANFGAGELLEIIRNDPQKGEEASFWVPFKNAFVPTVNTDKQEIRVTDDVVALFGSGVGTCTSPS
jgi:16S rRNA processing protein RimM